MRNHKWTIVILFIFLVQLYCISVASSDGVSSSTDEWTMFHRDLSRSGYTTGSTPTGPVKLLWTYETRSLVWSSPAVANGYVFVGCSDWNIYWFNASNGKVVWHFPTGNEVRSSPAIDNGRLYVGSDDGNVYCLDIATGTPLWVAPIGGFVRSSPAVAEDRVYVGSGEHDLFCLNASSGAKIWSYQTSHRVHSSPAVSDGVVYFATDDFHVYAVNASTANGMWRTHTGSVISSPSVYNGAVYIGSVDGYICSLNASTGDKIWEYLTGGSVSSSPAVAYGCVYIGSDDNNVYCLNASNGEKIWQTPTGYWVRSSPAVAVGNIFVGSEDYNLYCLDAFTGAKKWRYATENFVDSSPAIANGTLFVGSSDHCIYAFALGDSTDFLPSQYTISLPWTTIMFDVIACAVAAAIIFVFARFVRSNMMAKRNAESESYSQKLHWLSKHVDSLCILAIMAFSALFFVNLGNEPLWVADEQTYSQWAFHMFKDGDYMTPWAFGNLLMWIGKPPLFMWLMSLAYQVFGVTNFAARFWSAVFGTLSLLLVFYLGRKLYNLHIGFISALVLGTFTTFHVFARHAMLDVSFVFFILASLYFLLFSEKTKNGNRSVALGGLFFGLAFMIKQFGALLIPLIFFAYFIATRRSIRILFTKRFALFWLVGVLIAAPWMIYMTLCFGPDFWNSFFVFSGFMRASTSIEGHVGGYLFYFSYLISNENLFWITLLPFSAGLCAFNAVIKRSKEDTLILGWITIVLLLFTLIQTKLEWYILPAFPAFAIAISSFLYQTAKKIPLATHLILSKTKKIAKIAIEQIS
ncbi:MAG: PQQ-binding-like beta-propeller repeat protein [Candidatus Bathyarchaeota archaeon]|nr:PQQ-binding-like beta-propeller repeat protein [Candidatus Bathyarchaeota archaeon]